MSSTKTKKAAENLDYAELLKDATKTVTVDLPPQSGTIEQIREKNELALKHEGWTGQEYIISPAKKGRYDYYSNTYSTPARAKFERPFTREEIEADGIRLYRQHLKGLEVAATKRKKDITKLRELQTALGLPLYEGS